MNQQIRILLIDDNPTYLNFILGNFFDNKNYTIDTAESESIARVQLNKNDYDLVLLDLYLDESTSSITGLEIIQYVPTSTYIVGITAEENVANAARNVVKDRRVRDFLIKGKKEIEEIKKILANLRNPIKAICDKVKSLISNGKLDGSLNCLLGFAKENESASLENDILLLKRRFKDNLSGYNQQFISVELYNIENTLISNCILKEILPNIES